MLFLFSMTWGAVSGWWTPVWVLAGVVYAWLLYRHPVHFSRAYRIALAAVRASVVSLIGLLLVSPLFKTTTYQPQKPLILVAQDNSSSIDEFKPAGSNPKQVMQQLGSLQQQLGADYEVHTFHFNKELAEGLSPRFNGKQTDISSALQQLHERYANQNIGAVVLATDGLYNTGAEPEQEAQKLKNTLYIIALGDTTPRRDILIGNVNYNKTAFLGDNFMLEVLAEAYQSKDLLLHLNITEDGRPVHAQILPVTSENYRKTLHINLNADRKGIHRFIISFTPVPNEATTANNTTTVYIEVLDAKQKVLLVYNSPHPDISAVKQAIEQNKNYEVKAVSVAQLGTIKPSDYSLLILHQVTAGANPALKQLMANPQLPVWYMLGAQSNLYTFNQEQKTMQITGGQQTMQEAFALAESSFTAFALSDSTLKKVAAFPPLLVPFGNYIAGSGSQQLFRQKIGNVATQYPLYLFGKESNRNIAVLTGEGLWRWQLAEYETYGTHHAVEELLGQSVQYLTANANRQRFRVYPAKTVFDESENVILNAELYNEALELVNTPEVGLTLKNKNGRVYSYQFSRNQQSYQLDAGTLPAGEYTYTSTARLGNTPFSVSGQFSVQTLNLESRQSTANHQMLNRMANQSGGVMLHSSQLNRLADLIKRNDNIKTIEYEDQHYTDVIDVKWLLVLVVALLSTEWIVRKREGGV